MNTSGNDSTPKPASLARAFSSCSAAGAGITIYAPAIVLSTVFGWRLDLTILFSGLLVIVYTVAGGSDAVSHTQKYHLGVIFAGMFAAFLILLAKLPASLSATDALTVAGGFHKLDAVDFSLNLKSRYTFWSGTLGGMFLALSYFGTDQSQVQRDIGGSSLRQSRLGLMFNAVCKIPMQFFILLLGSLLFVFYQFEQPPIFFNQSVWTAALNHDPDHHLHDLQTQFTIAHAEKEKLIQIWLTARHTGDLTAAAGTARRPSPPTIEPALSGPQAKNALTKANTSAKANDSDYVFISFILAHLPHGLIGLLVAAFFAAALSSKAAELNALGSTTTVDIYRHLIKRSATDEHYVIASRCFTVFWGMVAIAFALFANLSENLLQAVNILGSVFYGVVLALFLVAFFLPRIRGTPVFCSALISQAVVFILYYSLSISYLWYNLIGCAACVAISILLQLILGKDQPQTYTDAQR